MTDEEMVAYLARCLVDPEAPRPSIETLLHAFLPAAHVDHVHADAICSLANAPDPEAAVHEALGEDVVVVPYLRPGFELSRRVAELAGARAVVLAHHGLVTWGETHEESYELTLELVGRAREYLGLPSRGCRAPEPEGRDVESFLVRLRGRLSRRASGSCSRPTARSDRSPTGRMPTRIARDAQHARSHAPDRRAQRCVVGLDGDPGRSRTACRVFLVRGLGGVAAGPDIRAARTRAEIAAHTHASVAATLDRFGGASWLDRRARSSDFETGRSSCTS